MSGGRGRGRGRGGYKPPTGAQLLMQRSAQESGLDEKNLRSLQDLTRPPLFPDFLWHSAGHIITPENESETVAPSKLSQSSVYLIRKGRDMQHRMHTSSFHLRPAQEVDVKRYGKRPRQYGQACDQSVIHHLGKLAATCRYVPDELLQPSIRAAAALAEAQRRNALLDDREDVDEEIDGESDEEENTDEIEALEEEEEDVEDYTMNYYASDNESDDGDDEPTF